MGKASSKLAKEDLVDLRNNTKFDNKELQQWYKGFLKACPSGEVTKDNLREVYRKFFPYGDPSAYSDILFQLSDTDNNGTIDFKEFITALSICGRGEEDDKLKFAFRMYDRNGDGQISYEEMLLIVQAIYRAIGTVMKLPEDESTPEKRVQKLFALMDTNKDGVITFNEFREGAKKDDSIMQALHLYDGLV